MNFLISLIALILFLTVPALVVWLCKRVKILGAIGAIILLYIIGILISNLFVFKNATIASNVQSIQGPLSSVCIPLALPLILFSCNLKKWTIGKAFKSLLIGILSVVVVVVAGYFIFRSHSEDAHYNKIAGLLVGVYTGGTPNLASLKLALDVPDSTYIVVHTFDVFISFVYLLFLMTVGIPLFRLLAPKGSAQEEREGGIRSSDFPSEVESYSGIFSKANRRSSILAILMSLGIAAVSIGMSLLITGKIDNMIVLILSLTTLSIGASFLPFVRRMEKSYDIGMYLVLIFSLAVASMVDFRSIDFTEGLWNILYITFVIFGSLFLQVILSRIFKVDADTTVITSVALINSPLFVPMIADKMKNRRVIFTGITVGIIGYALGNYLGIFLSMIL